MKLLLVYCDYRIIGFAVELTGRKWRMGNRSDVYWLLISDRTLLRRYCYELEHFRVVVLITDNFAGRRVWLPCGIDDYATIAPADCSISALRLQDRIIFA